jgi:hypothetical protein
MRNCFSIFHQLLPIGMMATLIWGASPEVLAQNEAPARSFKIVVAANAPEVVRSAAKQVLDGAHAENPLELLKVFSSGTKPSVLTDSVALSTAKLPERAYSHLILVGLPDDPMISGAWQREARPTNDGFYVFGWGNLRGDIGYIESDRNPFLHSVEILSAPYETNIVTLTGNTPAGVSLAVDAFLKRGLLNGVIVAPNWNRPEATILDREPLTPNFAVPISLPSMAGDATLIGMTAGGEDEARGVLEDTGIQPSQIWRAKYFIKGSWDGKGATGAFDNYSYGLHRRAYGNTLWMASFASAAEAAQAAPKIASAARLGKSGKTWNGNLPPYADGRSFGERTSAGPIRLWQRGELVFMSTLPVAQTDALIANANLAP